MSGLDPEVYRAQFPGLTHGVGGRNAVFFDGPAGSQVPLRVIDAIRHYLVEHNANGGGCFDTSRRSDEMLDEAQRAAADLFGGDDPGCVAFGANMTTQTFALSRALARTWKPGDEVIVTQLDHDANVTPWVLAARDAGATVRELRIDVADCTLDLEHLESIVGPRTVLVALTAASNAVGTVTPVRRVADIAHGVGALVFVDAVHYAAHRLMDVAAWDADFVACSAYKFFGPHVGLLWGRRPLLESLPAYKLRPAPDSLPGRLMTGTQSHEGIAGTLACIEYLADIGRDADPAVPDRRAALARGFQAIHGHEARLAVALLDALESIDGVTIHGIADRSRLEARVPTVSFVHASRSPRDIAADLGERGIFVWHGNYYALPLTTALGVEPAGMVRVGALHYNTLDECGRLAEALSRPA